MRIQKVPQRVADGMTEDDSRNHTTLSHVETQKRVSTICLPYLVTIESLLGGTIKQLPGAPPERNGKALLIFDQALSRRDRYKKYRQR